MEESKPFANVYLTYPRGCALVRRRLKGWRMHDDFVHHSVEAAWNSFVLRQIAAGFGRPDPSEHVVVVGRMAHERDERGTREVFADWSRTFDPQSFHEEIERERQLAEQQEAGRPDGA